MEDDLDSKGNECPNCTNLISRMAPEALFYTCGCFVCPRCSEAMPQCPSHYENLYRSGGKTLQKMLSQVQQLNESYEQTSTHDRRALDDLVKQVRYYAKYQRLLYQSLPAFQQLPKFTYMCPNCHLQVQGLKCQCGFFNWKLAMQAEKVPVIDTRETRYVTCSQCGSMTPKGGPHCYSCGHSLKRTESYTIQVWRCSRCSYEYNQKASCTMCHTSQPDTTASKPTMPSTTPMCKCILAWTCPCGFEYNIPTVSICLRCERPYERERLRQCQCSCANYKHESLDLPCLDNDPNYRLDESWKCPKCGEPHLQQETRCFTCGFLRLAAMPSIY